MSYLETGGRRHTMNVGEVRIGADPSCPIALVGAGIAPVHAVVQGFPDGQVAIRRATDEAEVLINGVRLGPQPSPLLHGDKVQIGENELLFVDERRSGSTVYVQKMDPAALAAAKPARAGQPTAATGGRVVSLTDGREYAVVGSSMVFGRDAGCDVVVTDKNVSRRHCEIMATPKGYVVVDSSTNGSFVNGQRVQGQQVLARADVIRVGGEEFRFYADVTAAPPPPAPPPAPAQASAPEPPRGAVPAPGAEYRLSDTRAGVPSVAKPPAPPPAVTGAPVLASVVIRVGPLKGQRLPIRVPVVNVGRADYNDLVLPDDSVSTSHAKIQRREGVWILLDLDSTNGTFVDGERVRGEMPLAPGALIRFGDVQALFEPTDDTIDRAKGSSTKVIGTAQAPSPKPPPEARQAPKPAAAAPPNRPPSPQPARRPAPRARPPEPASSGRPEWLIPAIGVVVAIVVLVLFLSQ